MGTLLLCKPLCRMSHVTFFVRIFRSQVVNTIERTEERYLTLLTLVRSTDPSLAMSHQSDEALISNGLSAPRLAEGQRFPNIEEAAHHLRDYCNHFFTHFRCKESRPNRYIAVCGDQAKSGCQWEVRLYTGKDKEGNDRGGQWEITQCQATHTCSGCQIPKWSSQNNKAWLARKVSVSSGKGETTWIMATSHPLSCTFCTAC